MGIIEQMKLAFAQPNLGQAEKAVLVALTFRAGRGGECWPSLADIADMCSMSRATASRALTGLIETGYIARRRRFSRSNTYKLQLSQIAMSANCEECKLSRLLPQIETIAAANCDTEHTIELNHKNKPTPPTPSRGRFVPVVPPEVREDVAKALNEWAQHRRDKKKPVTELQWEKLIEEAKESDPGSFCAKVTHSIKQGWQGLFAPPPPPKINGTNGTGTVYRNPDGTTFVSDRKY